MARLTSICMQIPLFRQIVGTKNFECKALRSFQKQLPLRARRPIIADSCCTDSYEGENEGYYDNDESSECSVEEKQYETIYVPKGQLYTW